ncbi:MAG: hypothetical protein JF604_26375, partial [Bradyrhizobium sp.]|nr:hypothetical protein [Bradyrhizobium sp.]
MCGIAGVIGGGPESLRAVRAMTSALRHRGPDDEGYLLADSRRRSARAYRGQDTVSEIADPPLPEAIPDGVDVALGHRRLSIIDLSPAGHGPMSSADGDAGTLTCARHRFGVKPLSWFRKGPVFAFASEIKALRAHPALEPRPHPPALHRFLLEGATDADEPTFVDSVNYLRAGHLLTVRAADTRVEVRRWYALGDRAPAAPAAGSFRALLEDAVRLRLRSDVDVGTCLSGGLDSSSLVALSSALRSAAGAP